MVNLDLIKSRLKQAIQHSGITQTKLAERLSVSQSCVAHYVKGDILPRIDKFALLCEILEVDPAYILGLED